MVLGSFASDEEPVHATRFAGEKVDTMSCFSCNSSEALNTCSCSSSSTATTSLAEELCNCPGTSTPEELTQVDGCSGRGEEDCGCDCTYRRCQDRNGFCGLYREDCRNLFWPEFSHPQWLPCNSLYCCAPLQLRRRRRCCCCHCHCHCHCC